MTKNANQKIWPFTGSPRASYESDNLDGGGGQPPSDGYEVSKVLDSFEYASIPVNYQDPLWNQYTGDPTDGPDPGTESINTTAGLYGNNALEIEITSTPANVYMQFYPALSSTEIAFAREFVTGYQLDTYNRLRFWAKLPDGLTRSGGGITNLHFGTYYRASNGDRSGFESGGNHYYHYHDVESSNGAWHQFIIDWHPSHIRGQNGNTEHGEKQYPSSEAGFNYFDLLTRFYFDAEGSVASAGDKFLFDGFEFYHEPNTENVAQIYSLNAVFDPTTNKISVNWNRNKDENSINHEVRYAFTSFHDNGGWTHGNAAPSGTVVPPSTGGYNQMYYDTTAIDVTGEDAIYIAIKPTNSALFRQIRVPLTSAGYPAIGGNN